MRSSGTAVERRTDHAKLGIPIHEFDHKMRLHAFAIVGSYKPAWNMRFETYIGV